MTIVLHLIIEFFKIGLFSIGGGYAAMPFLYQIVHSYGWYTISELTNMIAISVITPGPVGANMATFAGFKTLNEFGIIYGILGGIIATFSLVLPSYIIVVFVSKLLKIYKDSFWVKSVLYLLKPVGCGLLTSVCLNLIKNSVTNISSVCLLVFLFIISFKFKKNPLYYFGFSAVIGFLLYLLNFDLSNQFNIL